MILAYLTLEAALHTLRLVPTLLIAFFTAADDFRVFLAS